MKFSKTMVYTKHIYIKIVMNKSQRTGIIDVIIAAALWGLSGVCGEYLMQNYAISPNWLVPYRLTLAGAILVFYNIFKSKRDTVAIWNAYPIRLLIFSIFGITLTQYSYFCCVKATNAGTGTVLQQVCIVMVMLYTCFIEKRLPTLKENICVILAIAGVYLMATHGNINTLVISKEGLFWGMVCALAVSIYTVVPKILIKKFGSTTTTGWGMLTGGILLMSVFRPWEMGTELNPVILEVLVVIIIFGTVIPFSLYLKGVNQTSPDKAIMLSNVEPLTAAVLSALCLGDTYSVMDIIGAACILSTIFILAQDEKK